jgi:hypothetical protein
VSEEMKYSWSTDDSGVFRGTFETRTEAARQALDYETNPEFVRGHASWIVDNIASRADEIGGEYAEGYPGCTKQAEAELDTALANTIRDWLVQNNLQPSFCRVIEVEKWEPSTPGTPLAVEDPQP